MEAKGEDRKGPQETEEGLSVQLQISRAQFAYSQL